MGGDESMTTIENPRTTGRRALELESKTERGGGSEGGVGGSGVGAAGTPHREGGAFARLSQLPPNHRAMALEAFTEHLVTNLEDLEHAV